MPEKQEQVIPTVSKLFTDGSIVELLLRDGRTSLCVYQGGEWRIADEIKHSNGVLLRPIPIENNLISHGAVLLPSEPVAYESEAALRKEIKAYIRRYVHLSDDGLEVATSYVLMTWIHEALEEVPYLRFLGDLGSGKTRALKVIGSITNKPFFASAASTVSPIFYTLDTFAPTLILDEADMRYSDSSNEFVKILNNGNSKGMSVLRHGLTAKKGEFEPRAFRVFGPKILAMRKRFLDDGLESRFLTETMGTSNAIDEVPISLPKEQVQEALHLRNQLLFYRFSKLPKIAVDPLQRQANRSGRFNQMVLPLLAVTPGDVERVRIVRFAQRCDDKLQAVRQSSLDAVVKRIYDELSVGGTTQVAVGAIADAARSELDDSDRPITNKLVGSVLRHELGLQTWKSNGVYWCGYELSPQVPKVVAEG